MKKRLASVATMFAMIVGLLFTAMGTASATGGETSPTFECANAFIGQICDNVDDVVVTITHLDVLNNAELVEVENVLNYWAVTGVDDVNVVVEDVVNVYDVILDIDILNDNVVIIGWPCGHC